MKTKLAFAVLLTIASVPASAVILTGCTSEATEPAAVQAVQKYIVTVAGMT